MNKIATAVITVVYYTISMMFELIDNQVTCLINGCE